jgi:hypothetical protein
VVSLGRSPAGCAWFFDPRARIKFAAGDALMSGWKA